MLVAVADVPRRRRGLEEIVAGLASGPMPVVSWETIESDPALAGAFAHLVALDPPPGGRGDPLLRSGPRAHLAWGPAEAEFALLVYRSHLDLRPALADAYRALRDLDPEAAPDRLREALCGGGAHPRAPEFCALLVAVLAELELVEFSTQPPAARIPPAAGRRDLTDSPLFVASSQRLARTQAALAAEVESRPAARAA